MKKIFSAYNVTLKWLMDLIQRWQVGERERENGSSQFPEELWQFYYAQAAGVQ